MKKKIKIERKENVSGKRKEKKKEKGGRENVEEREKERIGEKKENGRKRRREKRGKKKKQVMMIEDVIDLILLKEAAPAPHELEIGKEIGMMMMMTITIKDELKEKEEKRIMLTWR